MKPIPARPVSENEKLLRQKFYENIASQSDLMDKLSERLLTLELAIPGLFAAVLKLTRGEDDLEVTPEILKKVFAHTADSFLGLVRQVLDMQYLPDYKDLVARQFESYITQHNYNADQIRFLRAVQSVFLQKRHLETADLYEPPLDMFGTDAVERWFTEIEVNEIIAFANHLDIQK